MQTDEQLMEQYLRGDERSFSVLYTRYKPLVTRIVQRNVFRKADLDDLVQQAFTQLHAARASYRRGALLRPWICTMTRNVCRDYGRRTRRRPETQHDMDMLSTPATSTLPGELGQTHAPLASALDQLSELTRRIFQEHFIADRALVDIARDLGANPNTVRVRVHRGCQQLRASLSD